MFSAEINEIFRLAKENQLIVILDCNISNNPNTNQLMFNSFYNIGFDALIINPFIGREGEIHDLCSIARKHNKGLILECLMSDAQATLYFIKDFFQGIRPAYELIAASSAQWGARGLMIGNVSSSFIGKIKSLIPSEILLFSMVGDYNTKRGDKLLEKGINYFFVGKSLFQSHNPRDTIMKLQKDLY